jgi:hypothetical protein
MFSLCLTEAAANAGFSKDRSENSRPYTMHFAIQNIPLDPSLVGHARFIHLK